MACFAESLLHNELNPIIDWFIHVYTTYFRYKWWYLFLGLPHYSHWWQWLLNYPSKSSLWANSPTAPKNRTAPNIRLRQVAVLTHRLQPDFAAHVSKFCTPKKSSWIIIIPIHESMAFHGNIPMLTLNISQGLTKEWTMGISEGINIWSVYSHVNSKYSLPIFPWFQPSSLPWSGRRLGGRHRNHDLDLIAGDIFHGEDVDLDISNLSRLIIPIYKWMIWMVYSGKYH
jgi:hypothetical protein